MAVAALVCGLVGLLCFGVVLGVLAIVFGAIALNKANREGADGGGMAIAGLVLGVIDIVLFVVLLVAVSNDGYIIWNGG